MRNKLVKVIRSNRLRLASAGSAFLPENSYMYKSKKLNAVTGGHTVSHRNRHLPSSLCGAERRRHSFAPSFWFETA